MSNIFENVTLPDPVKRPTGEWIGVDFDGTLATYDEWKGVGHIGRPVRLMCDRVRVWLSEGRTVKIFTARVFGRTGTQLLEVVNPINRFCYEQFGQILDITNVKDYGMIQLWDDRAIQVLPNIGIQATDDAYNRALDLSIKNENDPMMVIEKLKQVLREHHEWHQQEGLEMKLGDEYFDVASDYCDSSLEEKTTAALAL